MTPERFKRLRRTLERRQPDLTVLMENVHKPHNFSAILRTCDATGVFAAHAAAPDGGVGVSPCCSAGCGHWINVHFHDGIRNAVSQLRAAGFRLLAAHPHPQAIDYRQADFTQPSALLLGQEKDGLSDEALRAADQHLVIPMAGLGTSLNVSVAAAILLYEAQRQRQAAGLYETPRLEASLLQHTLFEWAYPRIAELCRRQRLPYPRLDEEGSFLDPLPR